MIRKENQKANPKLKTKKKSKKREKSIIERNKLALLREISWI